MADTIAVGADHRGYALKEQLKACLAARGIAVWDAGPESDEPVDYPVYAARVAGAVSEGRCGRGILICGSGIGMSVAANKFGGVRAALCHDLDSARMSRKHNNSNVLVLSAALPAATARDMLAAWIDTPFEGGRHQKRLDLIAAIERDHVK